MIKGLRVVAVSGLLLAALNIHAKADVVLGGPDSLDGSYSPMQLQTEAGATTVSSGGLTGISLWNFLGGANATTAAPAIYGAITTSTPAGDNGSNAILRYYLVATDVTGQKSVVSLGEVDPRFGGTSSPAPFVAFQATGGSLLTAPALILPNQPGRDLSNLTSVQIYSVPALPQGKGGLSTAVQLSGNVTSPGSYTQTMLQNNFAPVNELANGDVYTGVPLWAFIHPSTASSTDQIAAIGATDGFEVVFALAEIDPSLGGGSCSPGPTVTNCDILPYADTGTNFTTGAGGVARTIFPNDSAHARWVTNVNAISVTEAPEPASLTVFAVALAVIGSVRRRVKR